MSTPDSELHEHLQALFSGLDTRADFDTRLFARLHAESQADASERAIAARQQERARHWRAVSELRSWRRWMLRVLTLDTLGIAFLLVVAVVAAWPRVGRDAMDISRQYGPYIAMFLSLLIAAVPLLAMWAERTSGGPRMESSRSAP